MHPIPSPYERDSDHFSPQLSETAREADALREGGNTGTVVKTDLRGVKKGIDDARLMARGFSPLWRGAVRVVAAIPWLGKTATAQNAVNAIRRSDGLRAEQFETFTAGLEAQYGKETVDKMLDMTRLTPSKYLSTSTMQEARALAENVYLIGQNENLTNRMEMHVWDYSNFSKCGHIAVAIHLGDADAKPLSSNAVQPGRYISFWPGARLDPSMPQNGSWIGRMANTLFGIQEGLVFPPAPLMNYDADQRAMLGPSAQAKLSRPDAKPRPKQGRVGNAWGERADAHISVPFAGENFVANKSKPGVPPQASKTTFGLNPHGMETFWNAVRRDEATSFQMLSKTRNCSGMAARALNAGGADALLPQPDARLFLDPAAMQGYTNALMKEVAALNVKADLLDRTIGQMLSAKDSSEQAASVDGASGRVSPEGAAMPHAMRLIRARQAVLALSPQEHAAMRPLRKALDACESAPRTFDDRLRQMKVLVTGLHTVANAPLNNDTNRLLREAYHLYNAIRVDAHASAARLA
jgi:hypothetical protein